MSNTAFEVIQDTFSMSVDELLKVMPKAEKAALRQAANVVKKAAKRNFKSLEIDYNKSNPLYSDKLIDAIRSSKVRNGSLVVHTMGTRKSTSGTFRTRFFNAGTKDRFYTTKTGKKKYVGRIKKFNYFFSNAITQTKEDVVSKMDETLSKYIQRAWENAK